MFNSGIGLPAQLLHRIRLARTLALPTAAASLPNLFGVICAAHQLSKVVWRGKTKLDPSEHSMEATQKKLLAELEAMHMSGFRPNGSGPGPVSWRLDSRVIEAAKKK